MGKHDEQSRSHPEHGRGPSRHQGKDQHGWAPDVDETHQQDNPSAERSFKPGEHAPAAGRGRTPAREEHTGVTGQEASGAGRRGERQAHRKEEKGTRDTGRRGRSQRPSGEKDASSYTGVDPGGSRSGRGKK